jgi:hypothetical protein
MSAAGSPSRDAASICSLQQQWRAAVVRVRHAVREAKQDCWRRLTADLTNRWRQVKKKDFWNVLNWRRFGSRTDLPRSDVEVPQLRRAGGSTATTPVDVNEVFRQHYEALGDPARSDTSQYDSAVERFVNSRDILHDEGHDATAAAALNCDITLAELQQAKRQLHNGKAAGSDRVFGEFLKYGGTALDSVLLQFFNACWALETVPGKLREGVIVSLFKGKGSRLDPGNYRGITIMSVLGKLLCKILNNRLLGFLEQRNALHEAQAGFRTGRGCTDHQHTLSNIIQHRARQGLKTYAFFLDVRKAYDTVWRKALWLKLWCKRVQGKFLRFLVNMYGVTRCRTMTNGVHSDAFSIHQGVAQGCVLSTTLYDVFVDDLLRLIHLPQSSVSGIKLGSEEIAGLMLADDYVGLASTAEALQRNINLCLKYTREWRYQANVDKCAVVIFGPRTTRQSVSQAAPAHQFKWGAASVPVQPVYRYLGLMFHESCTWHSHINHIIAKSLQRIQALAPVLRDRRLDTSLKLQVYKAVIRPLLEYGSEVWQANQQQAMKLEQVQRRVCRMILAAPKWTPVEAMLLDLGLEPLQDRWDLLKLCWHRKLHRMVADRAPQEPARYPAVVATCTAGQRYRGGARTSAARASRAPISLLFVHCANHIWAGLPSTDVHGWGQADCAHRLGLFAQSHGSFQTYIKKQLWARTIAAATARMQHKTSMQLFAGLIPTLSVGQVPARRGMAAYLRCSSEDAGCCLQFKFRAGSVLLNARAHKFPGSLHAASPSCPCCGAAEESVQHVVMECPHYQADRERLLRYFSLVHPRAWRRWSSSPADRQCAWLLDDRVWGQPLDVTSVSLPADALSSVHAPHSHVQQFLLRLWEARKVHVAARS